MASLCCCYEFSVGTGTLARCLTFFSFKHFQNPYLLSSYSSWSSGGRVVKLLACGARGPGFDSRPRHLNFQRFVIYCFQVAIWLKYRWSDVNPQYNQPTKSYSSLSHDLITTSHLYEKPENVSSEALMAHSALK